jgi:hypothetical protein
MRNDVSIDRYADLHDRGTKDAQNGVITAPEIVAAARILQDLEDRLSVNYQRAKLDLRTAGLDEGDASQGAAATIGYALFATELSIRPRNNGTNLMYADFAGHKAISSLANEEIQNEVTNRFVASMGESWVEINAVTEITGVTREDIMSFFKGKQLERIADDKTGWRISSTDIRIGIATSPDSDLIPSDEVMDDGPGF